MEIYIPGTRGAEFYQNRTICVSDLEDQMNCLIDKMTERKYRGKTMKGNKMRVPLSGEIPEGTFMDRTPEHLELQYPPTETFLGRGCFSFWRKFRDHGCVPDTFPSYASHELVIWWHTDIETFEQVQELVEKDPKQKVFLRSWFYLNNGKLGKLVDLPPDIEDPRVHYRFGFPNKARTVLAETTPLDLILYQAALDQFNVGLDAFHPNLTRERRGLALTYSPSPSLP